MADPATVHYAQPLIGFRAWDIAADDTLKSISAGSIWPANQPMRSECSRTENCSKTNCHCGLYAYYDSASLIRSSTTPPPNPVLGVVIGRGDAALHPTGFRVHEAQIVALAPSRIRDTERVKRIAKKYGVPCVPAFDLADVAKQYGDLFDYKQFQQQRQQQIQHLPKEQQQTARQHDRQTSRDDIFANIFAAACLIILLGFMLATLMLTLQSKDADRAQTVRDPITSQVVPRPNKTLLQADANVLYPNNWRVAPVQQWMDSPTGRRWLLLFAGKKRHRPLPATATVRQQVAAARKQLVDFQQEHSDMLIAFKIASGLFIGMFLYIIVWFNIPVRSKQT